MRNFSHLFFQGVYLFYIYMYLFTERVGTLRNGLANNISFGSYVYSCYKFIVYLRSFGGISAVNLVQSKKIKFMRDE